MQATISKRAALKPTVARPASRKLTVAPRAAVDPQLVICGSTAAFLTLGRFVFLPYQRREAQWASTVPPKSSGNGYFEKLSQPASFTMTTNDPAGFNTIDVFGWGALGHAVAFGALGIASYVQ